MLLALNALTTKVSKGDERSDGDRVHDYEPSHRFGVSSLEEENLLGGVYFLFPNGQTIKMNICVFCICGGIMGKVRRLARRRGRLQLDCSRCSRQVRCCGRRRLFRRRGQLQLDCSRCSRQVRCCGRKRLARRRGRLQLTRSR